MTRERRKLKPPPKYDIIMYNDDVTAMDFVVLVLLSVFEYRKKEAVEMMLAIHNSESKIVGSYPKSIAEFKLQKVEELKEAFDYRHLRVEMRVQGGNNG